MIKILKIQTEKFNFLCRKTKQKENKTRTPSADA